jgi:hypothetical protein
MGYTDRLRLVLAPDDVVEATQSVLSLTWPIQDVKKTTGFVEFKLEGRPWYTIGEENLNVKYFMCSLLQRFYSLGWCLKAASDMQRAGSDTNVLFFHKVKPRSTSVICLSLNSTDKIRVLGPENIFSIIKNTVATSWPLGIQREQMFGQSYEIKLHGNPWTDWSRDSLESFSIPIMICEIMNNLFKNGWLYVGPIDTGKSQHSLNALYFYYAPDEINQNDLQNTKFFALSLNKNDRIRLHRATPDLISIMTSTSWGIPQLWRAGIQQQSIVNNALEFKLKGNPWYSNENEAVESRRLLNNIFNLLSRYGWHLYGTCDLTKHLSNKSTFFFRSKPIEPKTLVNFCVSLNETDKIRLIDYNPGLEQQVRMAIMQTWPKGIQMESEYFSSHQFKLKGYPFQNFDSSSDHVYACVLMIFILQNIESMGFRLLCSADVSGKYVSSDNNSYPVDLHSWFFEN